ncbi:MAG: class I SAM-dependent RNA methyltransferase [Oceanicaulis sp.]
MSSRRKPKAPPARTATLTAREIGARGDAVLDGPVYAPGLLPGEEASLEIRGERGRVIERLTTSEDRVAPFCPVAGTCGGCALQHFEETAYQRWKRGLAETALESAGISAELAPLLDAHGQGRRRLTFHAARIGRKFVFGFHERAGDRIADLHDCPVATPAIRSAVPALRQVAEAALPGEGAIDLAVADCSPGLDISIGGVRKIELALRETIAAAAAKHGWSRVTVNREPVIETNPPTVSFGDVKVTPPPGGFLQATEAGEAALAAVVMKAAGLVPGKLDRAVDLYAGSGAFALRLARICKVTAVEGEAGPLEALRSAANRTPGLKPVDARVRDLAREPLSVKELEGAGLVVLDPPRAGAKAQMERLSDSAVPVVCSISCNPATFARDAAILIEGGYRLAGPILPVDQFKWTGHLELAAVFVRKGV